MTFLQLSQLSLTSLQMILLRTMSVALLPVIAAFRRIAGVLFSGRRHGAQRSMLANLQKWYLPARISSP